MKLQSMLSEQKMEKEEKAEVAMCDQPKYPYGLCLRLDEETIKKLGLSELPEVGSYMNLAAKVEVVSVSNYESKQGGENRCLELQITDMGLENEKKQKDAAEALYGS